VDGNLWLGLGLSLVAGLATTVGSGIAFVVKSFSGGWLSALLGFSAGVMISVSFVELFAGAVAQLDLMWASLAFFAGFGVIFLVDVLVPHDYEGEDHGVVPGGEAALRRAGLLTAMGIAIHNFPEGIVVLAGAADSAKLAVLLTVAIAVHNIPEGIAVSVPILAATGDRKRAFMYSFLSGLAEPVGALVGAAVLISILTPAVTAATLAFVAGIMVFISFDELLPMAHRYGREHAASSGVLAGMAVMIATLVMLR